jgi:hypothetical protein
LVVFGSPGLRESAEFSSFQPLFVLLPSDDDHSESVMRASLIPVVVGAVAVVVFLVAVGFILYVAHRHKKVTLTDSDDPHDPAIDSIQGVEFVNPSGTVWPAE